MPVVAPLVRNDTPAATPVCCMPCDLPNVPILRKPSVMLKTSVYWLMPPLTPCLLNRVIMFSLRASAANSGSTALSASISPDDASFLAKFLARRSAVLNSAEFTSLPSLFASSRFASKVF